MRWESREEPYPKGFHYAPLSLSPSLSYHTFRGADRARSVSLAIMRHYTDSMERNRCVDSHISYTYIYIYIYQPNQHATNSETAHN